MDNNAAPSRGAAGCFLTLTLTSPHLASAPTTHFNGLKTRCSQALRSMHAFTLMSQQPAHQTLCFCLCNAIVASGAISSIILYKSNPQRPARGNVNEQWQHDKFPGNIGAQSRKPAGGLGSLGDDSPHGNKLEVSNLHYEIMPKDLIVRPSSPAYALPLAWDVRPEAEPFTRRSLDKLARSCESQPSGYDMPLQGFTSCEKTRLPTSLSDSLAFIFHAPSNINSGANSTTPADGQRGRRSSGSKPPLRPWGRKTSLMGSWRKVRELTRKSASV